jgi:prevent-host-death family protein
MKAMLVTVDEAHADLSHLLERIASGDEIIIARRGQPVARLSPVRAKSGRQRLGSAAGEFRTPDDFNQPLPSDVEDAFWR